MKNNKKTKKRICLLIFICLIINGAIFYSLGKVWQNIYEKKLEKESLTANLTNLKEDEEKLKVEVNKLKDPAYIAKYAREKFLYSGKNEYIIKIK